MLTEKKDMRKTSQLFDLGVGALYFRTLCYKGILWSLDRNSAINGGQTSSDARFSDGCFRVLCCVILWE